MEASVRSACASLQEAGPDEDPRYRDAFVDIKQEIDKLQGADLGCVVQEGLSFLAHEAKDLRVAGYLALALVARFGAPGLMTASLILRALVEDHWEQLHPRKPTQRRSALSWLNGARMHGLMDAQIPELNEAQWQALQENLEALEALLAERMGESGGDDPVGWALARRWLEDKRPAQASTANTDPASESAAGTVAVPVAGLPELCADESLPQEQLHEHVRILHETLLTQGQRLQALGLALAARWGALQEPPSEGGVTRIPPPRAAAWNELESLAQSDLEEAYRLGARLMFETGFQWSLDLQHRLAGLARELGDKDLHDHICGQTRLLLNRLPGITALHYSDGTAFAGDGARAWVEGLSGTQGGGRVTETRHQAFDELARQAREEKDLSRAFALLEAMPATTARQRCRMDLLRAELCLGAKRPHVAYGVLMELKRRVEGMQVMDWDPEVSTQLYESLRRAAIALKSSQGNGKGSTHPGTQPGMVVEECERLIAGLNPARALQLV
jgi:type VI secretion system protein VasJ